MKGKGPRSELCMDAMHPSEQPSLVAREASDRSNALRTDPRIVQSGTDSSDAPVGQSLRSDSNN
jgi:hypothetical protein